MAARSRRAGEILRAKASSPSARRPRPRSPDRRPGLPIRRGEHNRAMADGESEKQRVDRELIELLNELRVALPGVQVLFAFLLTIPFSRGWPKTTQLEHDLFFLALLAAVASTVLLMAPSAYHRILFRSRSKERMLLHANLLALLGLATLAVSLGAS